VQWIRPLLHINQKGDIIKQAQEMMAGVILVNGKRIQIGPPGSVNWKAASAGANRGATGWPWDLDTFYPLLAAYIFTGEHRYMDGWAAYATTGMNQHDGPALPALPICRISGPMAWRQCSRCCAISAALCCPQWNKQRALPHSGPCLLALD
jgi:hypothetical protein